MRNSGRRESFEAAMFYGIASLAIVVWWCLLFLNPGWQVYFFGASRGDLETWSYTIPDLITALCMLFIGVPLSLKNSGALTPFAWLTFGATGYAFLKTITLAWLDPSAYWGVAPMMMLTGVSCVFAVRFSASSVLWGAFRFRRSKTQEVAVNLLHSVFQTIVMWSVFLVVIPTSICLLEVQAKWHYHWILIQNQVGVGSGLFCMCGFVGILSMWAMAKHGKGSPLPSACAHELVVAGPYRFVRNPMALSGVGQGVSIGIAIGSPIIMVYSLLGGVAWEVLVRREEEAYLLSQFGEAFENYCQRVRCWIPFSRP